MTIDLNCDLGESTDRAADEALMPFITSANIACGGHAGDDRSMQETIRAAMRHGVAIGAHPGYPDEENFGRVHMNLSRAEIEESVARQIEALNGAAKSLSATITHVKAHGALYNESMTNLVLARAVALGVAKSSTDLMILGLAGSPALDRWRAMGFTVVGEAFADRRYESNGSLRSRVYPDALITDPEQAAAQAVRIVKERTVAAIDGSVVPLNAQTICIHSDTPNAVAIAQTVRTRLDQNGIAVTSFSNRKTKFENRK
ncbi:MAG TPA: 5-oxoprolinase subunit PxpA [Bacteroidota bacterium]|nr:5-oxoprolinase subunit PxpA [Bacteroidota bacterium]